VKINRLDENMKEMAVLQNENAMLKEESKLD